MTTTNTPPAPRQPTCHCNQPGYAETGCALCKFRPAPEAGAKTTHDAPPATRAFCVWADHVRRVYQVVEAESPEQAYAIARDRPECFDDCFEFEDRDDFRLSTEVLDVQSDEYVSVLTFPEPPHEHAA